MALISEAVAAVGREQEEAVQRAADLITASLDSGGVVQAFGCGHSEALAMEIAGRAGGLVPTNRIALRDIVLYGGLPREVLEDPMLERDPTVAHRLYELTAIKPADVFVVASNSGINGVVVEFALLVKEHGHQLIAITSTEHSARSTPRHPSGKRLSEIADIVLDNGAPYGDAAIGLPDGGAVGAVSSVTAAVLAQMIVTEVVRRQLAAGQTPPIYLSANVDGGHEHNQVWEQRYAGRIRRTA
nr:SIS domain-containing protein [Allocatelliglobosispora scoriae]